MALSRPRRLPRRSDAMKYLLAGAIHSVLVEPGPITDDHAREVLFRREVMWALAKSTANTLTTDATA